MTKLPTAITRATVKPVSNRSFLFRSQVLVSFTHIPLISLFAFFHTFLALWPVLHYLLWQDVAVETTPESEYWNAYLRANEAYAAKLASIYQPGDLIWVHDYHLLLLPKIFKNISVETSAAHIGLFVHTPFPSSEVFRCLPSECFVSFIPCHSACNFQPPIFYWLKRQCPY